MAGDLVAAEMFAMQQEDLSNTLCCDCGTAGALWASVSHGTYISIEAAGVHRSLGVKTSFVLSTTMDSWKPVHLRMMELGGNQRFKDFLREQGVPEDLPIRRKYTTRAAAWYRENLRAQAEGREPLSPLQAGTGHLPADGVDGRSDHTALLDEIFAAAPRSGSMLAGGTPQTLSSTSTTSRRGCCASAADLCKRASERLKAALQGSNSTVITTAAAAQKVMAPPVVSSPCGLMASLATELQAAKAKANNPTSTSDWWSDASPTTEQRLKLLSSRRMDGFGPGPELGQRLAAACA